MTDAIIIKPLSIAIEIDPLRKHPEWPSEYVDELCGFLRPWAESGLTQSTDMRNIKDALEAARGFPSIESAESTTLPDGTHQYPEDPDLYPVIRLSNHKVEIFIYEYAMITFRDIESGDTFTTRMD